MTLADGGRHLSELEIASYLDRGLSNTERGRLEDHLVDCSECRHSVAESQHLIAKLRRPQRLATFAGLGGLLAVAAAALFVVAPELKRRDLGVERVSRDAIESTALAAYEPAGNTVKFPIRFIWGAALGAVSYRITLSSAEGTPVWSANVTDTTATLPDGVTLQRDTSYFWFADAILNDGSTRSTGLRQLGPVSRNK